MTRHGHAISLLLLLVTLLGAQGPDDSSLEGAYFLRQIQFVGDAAGNVYDARSLVALTTFDGEGGFTFQGTMVVGNSAGEDLTGAGAYSVQPGGFVTLSSPLRIASPMNARLGSGILIGANTGEPSITDLLVAIPTPAEPVGDSSLNGSYWVASIDMPEGAPWHSRSAFFQIEADGAGALGQIQVQGMTAEGGGQAVSQTVTGATYELSGNGAGTITFPAGEQLPAVSGTKSLYLGDGGDIWIAAGAVPNHDLLIGIRAMPGGGSAADWQGLFWSAGIRWKGVERSSYVGAANVPGPDRLVWTRRLRYPDRTLDFTGVNRYSLENDGHGSAELNTVALGGGGGLFIGSGVSALNPGNFELYLGVRSDPVEGNGVFLHPNGVVNAAGFAPAGNPISPGGFITLFGSGLAPSAAVSEVLPFPLRLAGVSVSINGRPAPVYVVSSNQISVLVPQDVTGETATIVADNNGERSNAVTVPLAATSPGIFTIPPGGTGSGAILKTDWSVVNPGNPIRRGEVAQIYLTGLGEVDPPVPDGAAAPADPLSWVTSPVKVYVGGKEAEVLFQGLAPSLAGLYQLNIRVPGDAPTGDAIPLAVETPDAFHDQVDIAVTR